MHSYTAYGLGIRSEISFPELVPSDLTTDVLIRYGPTGLLAEQVEGAARLVTGTSRECVLYWRNIGAFAVRQGSEIIIDPAPGVEERVLRPFVLGSSLGVLLLQRGLMVFHASVVSFGDVAAAFLARKGYGKSTLAATLYTRGHELVADDIVALSRQEDGLFVRPGFPLFKLWPDSVSALGQDPGSLPVLGPSLEKRAWRITEGFAGESMPLGCIYVLDGGAELCIRPLLIKQALMHVLPHWYGAMFDGELLGTFGLGNHFRECADLVQAVPTYVVERPVNIDLLDDSAEMVERHFAGLSSVSEKQGRS